MIFCTCPIDDALASLIITQLLYLDSKNMMIFIYTLIPMEAPPVLD
ncbi:MAG: hypothetical protein IKY14_01010 [Erysipelotrichaceae bacterium]|nr:hypothetical protein [Erysipelotrichaceae bacterium]